jgi:hypothetical protein
MNTIITKQGETSNDKTSPEVCSRRKALGKITKMAFAAASLSTNIAISSLFSNEVYAEEFSLGNYLKKAHSQVFNTHDKKHIYPFHINSSPVSLSFKISYSSVEDISITNTGNVQDFNRFILPLQKGLEQFVQQEKDKSIYTTVIPQIDLLIGQNNTNALDPSSNKSLAKKHLYKAQKTFSQNNEVLFFADSSKSLGDFLIKTNGSEKDNAVAYTEYNRAYKIYQQYEKASAQQNIPLPESLIQNYAATILSLGNIIHWMKTHELEEIKKTDYAYYERITQGTHLDKLSIFQQELLIAQKYYKKSIELQPSIQTNPEAYYRNALMNRDFGSDRKQWMSAIKDLQALLNIKTDTYGENWKNLPKNWRDITEKAIQNMKKYMKQWVMIDFKNRFRATANRKIYIFKNHEGYTCVHKMLSQEQIKRGSTYWPIHYQPIWQKPKVLLRLDTNIQDDAKDYIQEKLGGAKHPVSKNTIESFKDVYTNSFY